MTLPILRRRMRGPRVQQMQQALIRAASSDHQDCLGAPFPGAAVLEDDGIFGQITEGALISFQTLKNRANPAFDVDGICGSDTWAALGEAHRPVHTRHVAAATPARSGRQGRRAGQATNLFGHRIEPPAGSTMPSWMVIAWGEHAKNVRERSGGERNNPNIIRYLSVAPGLRSRLYFADDNRGRNNRTHAQAVDASRNTGGHAYEASFEGRRGNEVDETPWCGCFVQWCLLEAGFPRRPNLAAAVAWRPNGAEVSPQRYGAVTVIERGGGKFHVGFFVQAISGGVKLLGGNQRNRVSVREYHGTPTYNWPVSPTG